VRFQKKAVWRDFWGRADWAWVPVKRLGEMQFGGSMVPFMREVPRVMLRDSLDAALEGTPFARAWDDDYVLLHERQDGVRALDLLARYPCVEYLTKGGYQRMIVYKLDGRLPNSEINWKGRRIEEVLKISRQRLGQLKAQRIPLTPEVLAVLQVADGMGARCGEGTAAAVAHLLRGSGQGMLSELRRALEYHQPSRRGKALKYMARYAGAPEHRFDYRLSDFADYWSIEAGLEANLNDDAVAFPKDFAAAHRRADTRRRYAYGKKQDDGIKKRLDRWKKKYAFEFGGLILRPAVCAAEVVREGEVLGHCVGSYVERYAKGETVICVLRRAVQPDEPWRTVEIGTDGKVKQDRGYKNDWGGGIQLTDEYRAMLDLFWQAWKERGTVA
jgi:hypothetical protein